MLDLSLACSINFLMFFAVNHFFLISFYSPAVLCNVFLQISCIAIEKNLCHVLHCIEVISLFFSFQCANSFVQMRVVFVHPKDCTNIFFSYFVWHSLPFFVCHIFNILSVSTSRQQSQPTYSPCSQIFCLLVVQPNVCMWRL